MQHDCCENIGRLHTLNTIFQQNKNKRIVGNCNTRKDLLFRPKERFGSLGRCGTIRSMYAFPTKLVSRGILHIYLDWYIWQNFSLSTFGVVTYVH